MLECFLLLKNAVQKALIDIKQAYLLNEADCEIVAEIVAALQPVDLAVKALCRCDINLITAFNFCIVQLAIQRSELGVFLPNCKNVYANVVLYMQVYCSICMLQTILQMNSRFQFPPNLQLENSLFDC
jgi:hypothetical protein